mgnify:CR=1 FL=1
MATIMDLAQKMLRGEAPPPPIGRLLGFTLKSIEPGRAVFEMEVDDRHHNPMGAWLHLALFAPPPALSGAAGPWPDRCPTPERSAVATNRADVRRELLR